MKVDCNRENLANAFALAASVAPARSPKEILQFVKLTATESGIVLTATDLE
ncbi:MAG: DNA polymerase III subunit beta, partial [Planctomycetota bacterium]